VAKLQDKADALGQAHAPLALDAKFANDRDNMDIVSYGIQ
jgi:hypothetical protein